MIANAARSHRLNCGCATAPPTRASIVWMSATGWSASRRQTMSLSAFVTPAGSTFVLAARNIVLIPNCEYG